MKWCACLAFALYGLGLYFTAWHLSIPGWNWPLGAACIATCALGSVAAVASKELGR